MSSVLKQRPQPRLDEAPFVLRELEVFNWGGFHGLHSVKFDEAGAAIVGMTGSGKTTLVDGLMTLLAEHPRYNLASTGGHDSDRSLAAYVRGELGSDTSESRRMLRPPPTLTGVSALFGTASAQLRLTAVLWYSNADEMTKAWITDLSAERTLEHWLTLQRQGGMKALKQVQREGTGVQVYANNKKEFAAAVRRFFEVGDNAFTLLSRAVGMKQINSMDQLFRQLVLEDNSQFDRAEEVAQGFDTLTQIHEELVTARRQIESLEPIAARWEQYKEMEQRRALHDHLLKISTSWFAQQEHAQLTAKITRKHSQLNDARAQWVGHDAALKVAIQQAQSFRDAFVSAGGLNIEHLQGHIESQNGILSTKAKKAAEYLSVVRRVELDEAISERSLSANKQQLTELIPQAEKHLSTAQEQKNAASAHHYDRKRALEQNREELEQVKRSPSNIKLPYQNFRADLARHLELGESQVPFVAELVQVKTEQSAWRGAIERAIGNHRLRILVPDSHMNAAVRWVNSRNSGLHVRLLEVDRQVRSVEFFPDGFTRKLEFKPHPYREALKALLKRIDRHCVNSADELVITPYAMTIEGTMSSDRGYIDKQDHNPLERDWTTGFDNRDRLRELNELIVTLLKEWDQSREREEAAMAVEKKCQHRIMFLRSIEEVNFADIDEPGAQQKLNQLNAQLEALVAPGSKVHVAKQQYDDAQREVEAAGLAERGSHDAIKHLENEITAHERDRKRAHDDVGDGLSDAQRTLATEHFPKVDEDSNIAALRRSSESQHQNQVKLVTDQLSTEGRNLTAAMSNAKHVDTGALAEAGVQIEDVPIYLERLRVLQEEALPAKQKGFLTYLNDSSDKDVTELLSEIDSEVSRIQERIGDLNCTLQRVDFLPGIYLRLVPQMVHHLQLRTFQQAQRNIRSAHLADDKGESHFVALREMVNLLREAAAKRRSTSEADRALLDPRYRMSFAVALCDRTAGTVLQQRTGSQGDSGGEKENMASFVLISSLGYALCPPARQRPLFGTVVLDEAFSKSSTGVGNAVMLAMKEFGLCPVLVTPNKEMRLLRRHTRSAIIVQRVGNRSVAKDISWEMLDTMRSERA